MFDYCRDLTNLDANNDSEVNIADVNMVISFIFGKSYDNDIMQNEDVNGNYEINISYVNPNIKVL